jgi:hypothetical protein
MQLTVPSAGNKGNPYSRQYNEISTINYNQQYTSILPNDTYHHINLFISTSSNIIKPWKGMHVLGIELSLSSRGKMTLRVGNFLVYFSHNAMST